MFFLKHASLSTSQNSSVNLTWFALLSYQKIDDRPLVKPEALWYAAILNSLETNILGA